MVTSNLIYFPSFFAALKHRSISQCHSDYNKATEVNEHGHHIPQCGFDGSYKQTQCNRESGECWCVDKNGKEKPETRTTEMPQCQLKGMLGLIFFLSLPFLSTCSTREYHSP